MAVAEGPGGTTVSVRQELLERLRRGPVTLRALARDLGQGERDVAEHLAHVRRSDVPGARFRREPAGCEACGFVFAKRSRLTAPSRCPRCKGERIRPAAFWVGA